MTGQRPGSQVVRHGKRFERHVAERLALPGPREEYLYNERRLMRYACPWGAVPSLVGIPIGTTHDVPVALAIIAGAILAIGFILLAATWRRRWSWPTLVILVVAVVWPAAVLTAWLFFWALTALFFALCAWSLRVMRRTARRQVARFGERYADWPRPK